MPTNRNVLSPLVIVGPGRSASSWIIHNMNSHPDCETIIENSIVDDIFNICTRQWWTSQLSYVCNDEDWLERVVITTRQTFLSLFPGTSKAWCIKNIWAKHEWNFFHKVFPEAKFLHVIRNPLQCVLSMTNFVGSDYKEWRNIEFSQRQYITAHHCAIKIRDLGYPYLQIKFEDIGKIPQDVLDNVCRFAGLPLFEFKDAEVVINAERADRVFSGIDLTLISKELTDLASSLGYPL